MGIVFFLKGIVLGLAIAAPVGPIGVLCIRRTLQFGRSSGLFSGLGAATADLIYAIIAAFGLTVVADVLVAGQFWLQLIGGVFLLYLGWRTFFAKVNDKNRAVSHTTLVNDFVSTFLLTLANPMTIFAFVAIFAGLGLPHVKGGYFEASALVGGVFVGSTFWWLLLSEGVTLFRGKMTDRVMLWINKIAGIMMVGFGAGVLYLSEGIAKLEGLFTANPI